jgi:hypothetical protein
MRYFILSLSIGLLSLTASAAPLTYISSAGDDNNPCSRSAPCRTFAGGLGKTDANGDLIVLDSGIYGPLRVTKSVRVTAIGVYAGTGGPSYDAASVSVGPNDVVVLKGLTMSGGRAALDYTSGGTLHVEGCTITRGEWGIAFRGTGRLFVKDSIITNNYYVGILVGRYNCSWTGIPYVCGEGTAIASIDHCQIEGYSTGVVVGTTEEAIAKVTIRDSTIRGAGTVSQEGPNAQVNIYDCMEVVDNR